MSAPTFSITVRMGNDAMQTAEDLRELLERVRSSVDTFAGDIERGCAISSSLRDVNGNTVGGWSFDPGA